MEDFPKKIILQKINTLEDAEYPQKEKYPDGTQRKGLMWEFSKPKVGEAFLVLVSKMSPIFHTSIVQEIINETDKEIKFKTLNSTYLLKIEEENG